MKSDDYKSGRRIHFNSKSEQTGKVGAEFERNRMIHGRIAADLWNTLTRQKQKLTPFEFPLFSFSLFVFVFVFVFVFFFWFLFLFLPVAETEIDLISVIEFPDG